MKALSVKEVLNAVQGELFNGDENGVILGGCGAGRVLFLGVWNR